MASSDARPQPLKNSAYRVYFPILDADGDLVTGAAGLDSEISKDGGTFTDCSSEATEIATSSGMYYLDLTSTEMNADAVCIIVKTSTSGAKTTPIVLYPAEATDIPVNVTAWNGTAVATPDTAGYPKVTIKSGTGTGEVSLSGGKALLQNDAITAAVIATNAIDADALASNAGAELADAIWDEALSGHTTAGSAGKQLSDAGAGGTPPSVADIADAVWDEVLSGHRTSGSTGDSLYMAGVAIDPTDYADAIWNVAVSTYGGEGTTGKALGDLSAGVSPADIADAVWDEVLSGHLTAGSVGKALDDAKDGDYVAGSAAAATNAARGFTGLVLGTATIGTLTTTAFTTSLTEATNDHYKGRSLTFTGGALAGQMTTITAYDGATKRVTVEAMTEAPANGDAFFIA